MNPQEKNLQTIFVQRLNGLMQKNHTTQEQLAKVVGVRRQTISLYCNGQSRPDYLQIASIAQFFRVTTDYLIGLSDGKNETTSRICDILGISDEAVENIKNLMHRTSVSAQLDLSWTNRILFDHVIKEFPNMIKIPHCLSLPKVLNKMLESEYALTCLCKIIANRVNLEYLSGEIMKKNVELRTVNNIEEYLEIKPLTTETLSILDLSIVGNERDEHRTIESIIMDEFECIDEFSPEYFGDSEMFNAWNILNACRHFVADKLKNAGYSETFVQEQMEKLEIHSPEDVNKILQELNIYEKE